MPLCAFPSERLCKHFCRGWIRAAMLTIFSPWRRRIPALLSWADLAGRRVFPRGWIVLFLAGGLAAGCVDTGPYPNINIPPATPGGAALNPAQQSTATQQLRTRATAAAARATPTPQLLRQQAAAAQQLRTRAAAATARAAPNPGLAQQQAAAAAELRERAALAVRCAQAPAEQPPPECSQRP